MTFKEVKAYVKVNPIAALWVDYNSGRDTRYRIVYNYDDGQSIIGYVRPVTAVLLLRGGFFDANNPAYESEYTVVYRVKEQP